MGSLGLGAGTCKVGAGGLRVGGGWEFCRFLRVREFGGWGVGQDFESILEFRV